eukprot:1142672-Pelagomonas_calceolata.AAC.6
MQAWDADAGGAAGTLQSARASDAFAPCQQLAAGRECCLAILLPPAAAAAAAAAFNSPFIAPAWRFSHWLAALASADANSWANGQAGLGEGEDQAAPGLAVPEQVKPRPCPHKECTDIKKK